MRLVHGVAAIALACACSSDPAGPGGEVGDDGETAGDSSDDATGDEGDDLGGDDDLGGGDDAAPLPTRVAAPIVLLHGMAGFDQIGPLDYYYGVAGALAEDGHEVFTTEVDPFQTAAVRAAHLVVQLDAIRAETGADRVHLVAHSQGGIDARYLVASLGYGDHVASLTTISTPHHGSRVADVATGLAPGASDAALAFLGAVLGAGLGSEQDLATQVHELTSAYADGTFNPANPDDPRVAYYSVAGVTTMDVFVDPATEDRCDPTLTAGYALLAPAANDGLVTVASATHGTFLGTVPADHLDEVGQLLGSTAAGFDHLAFYRALAAFLTDPAAPPPL